MALNADLSNDGSVWGDAGVSARNTVSTGSIGTNVSTGTVSFATLNNSGTISGAGIGAGVTSNTGSIVSTGNIGIVDGLDNFGLLSAQGEVSSTGGQTYNSGQINGNTVTIGAVKLTNLGAIQSDGRTLIYGGAMDNLPTGQIHAGTSLKFDMSGDGANRGKITSGGAMDVQFAGALTNTKDNAAAFGLMASGAALNIQAASLANDGGTLQAAGTLTVQSNGAISNGTAAGNAGSMRGTQVTLNGSDVRNEGLIQATSGPVTINASGAFSSTGGNAAVDAPSTLTITAKSIDNGAGSKLQAAQDITLTATAGGVTNGGTIYGPGGAPANITINASGGGFANTGTAIAGSKLNITGTGYTNSGTVGSLGDAKLATGAYDPDNAIIALGTLDIGSGFTIGAGKGWSSAAATTRWAGKITNYGSLYLKGTGVGDVDNLSSGAVLLGGTPATTTAYEVRDWSPPPELKNATIVGYTDVATRAQFVAGGLSGTLVNRASDASTTGAGYDAQEVKQSIVWGGTVWDPAQNKDVYQEVGVANAAASISRLIVPSGGSITLTGPNTGTIIGTNYTIKGTDLTVGQSMDGASSQLAMTGARERTVNPGRTPNAQVLTPMIGHVGSAFSQSGDLLLDAGGTLRLKGQEGTATVAAAGQMTLRSGQDLDVAGMTIAASKGVTLGAGGSIQANQSTIQSDAGQVSLEAGADINLQAASVKGAQGVSLQAGGNINLDAIEQRESGTTQTVASHTQQILEFDSYVGDGILYREVTQVVKDSTTTVKSDTVRHIGTTLDGGAGDLTVVAGGNVTGRGADLKAQGRTTVTGENVNLSALVDRTSSTTEIIQHAYGEKPVETTAEVKETLYGGTVQGGQGVTITARSDKKTEGNVTLTGVRVDGGAGGITVAATGNVKAEAIALNGSRDTQKAPLYTSTMTSDETGQPVTVNYYDTSNTVTEKSTSVQQAGSVFDGGKGDVRIQGGGNVDLSASKLRTDSSITVQGANVTLGAKINSTDQTRQASGTSSAQHAETLANTSLNAGGNLSITASGTLDADGKAVAATGDVKMEGAQVRAGGLAIVTANNDILLNDVTTKDQSASTSSSRSGNFLRRKTTTTSETETSETSHGTSIDSGMTALAAGRNITGTDAQVSGTKGVLLSAQGGIGLIEGRNTHSSTSDSQTKVKTPFGNGWTSVITGTQLLADRATGATITSNVDKAAASTVRSANGGVSLQAGGLALLRGVDVQAKDNVVIQGSGVLITAASDYSGGKEERTHKGISLDFRDLLDPVDPKGGSTADNTTSTLVESKLTGANVRIAATGADGNGGSIKMSGTVVNTPGQLELDSGAKGTLELNLEKTAEYANNTASRSTGAWQSVAGDGKIVETAHYNQFTAGAGVVFKGNPAGITAQVGTKDSVSQLAQQPGLEWMGKLAADPKVDWKKVELEVKNWDYRNQGLTPAGGALVVAVVTYLTWGYGEKAGVAIAGALGAEGTAATVIAAGVQAGVITLAGEASVALINNKGDIGKALHDLGSSANVHGLITAVLTAGVLKGLKGLNLAPAAGASGATGSASQFMTQLGSNLQAGFVRAVIGTAVNGGSFEDSLTSALTSSLIDTVAAQAANTIGDNFDGVSNKIAHAVAGCAVGAARQGASGCAPGALGAVVGEIAAEFYGKRPDTAQFAAMMGSLAVAATGGDAAQIGLAGQAAANAATYNRLAHPPEQKIVGTALDATKGNPAAQQSIVDAACALTYCAAGLSPNHPDYADAVASQNRGSDPALKPVRDAFLATGMFGYPTEEELRDRITRQLKWRDSSDAVALIWHGYLTALLEWGLLEVYVFDRLHALLPRVGNEELYELSSGEPLSPEQKREIDEYLRRRPNTPS